MKTNSHPRSALMSTIRALCQHVIKSKWTLHPLKVENVLKNGPRGNPIDHPRKKKKKEFTPLIKNPNYRNPS